MFEQFVQIVGGANHGPLGLYVVEAGDGESPESKVLLDKGEYGLDEVTAFFEVGLDCRILLFVALAFDHFVVLVQIHRPACFAVGALGAVRTGGVGALIPAQMIASVFAVAGAAEGEFAAVGADANIALFVVDEIAGGVGFVWIGTHGLGQRDDDVPFFSFGLLVGPLAPLRRLANPISVSGPGR